MIVELGHFALILALAVAVIQGTLPMLGAARNHGPWMELARTAALGQVALVGLSFACLMYAYVVSDFSVVNVVRNSHSLKPMLYKVSGTWGNHEGSMLLWVLILALFGAAVAAWGRNLPPALKARTLAVQAWIAVGFYLFILLTSNPFVRMLPPPADGLGLNPLLQDPGLAFHPPLLYLGYVGFSIVFSFAIAALIEGRVDAAWARWVRPWTLSAWAFLTAGIALGSWWAYYELGWGGWWFWDPVENASFLPWLTGTALLHSAIVVEKRETLKAWTIFLAIVTFGLSLLGTFLVRSGVLTSVHAFATDPTRGVFILLLLVIVLGGSFALFAWRGPQLAGGGLFRPVSREGGLLLNNLILCTAAAAVLLGTLYPLMLEAVGGGKVSVGPPFFNAVFVPLMVPLIIAMAVGPLLPWKRGDLGGALQRLWIAGAAAAVAGAWAWTRDMSTLLGLLGMAMAAWLLVGTLVELAGRIQLFRAPVTESLRRLVGLPRSAIGMTLAHAGLAIALVGMTGDSVWKLESIQVTAPGETVTVGRHSYTFEGAREVTGPNYLAIRGSFRVERDGRPVTTLEPERRRYPVERGETTEAAIHPTWLGDLYVTLGDSQGGEGAFVTRIYFNPFIVWLWTGVGLMVGGGLVSLADRRLRVGAPAPRRARATAPSPSAPATETVTP
ncbi:MAG: heme lyase CcmF/NrfE family subunit [Rhodospirillales bacterium]|nr:MAG: heme lyase CcmF/NrfE family subunit [Rhodospirillales bacterium]